MKARVSSLRARLALVLLLAALPPMGIVTYVAREWRHHEVDDAERAAIELARHGAKQHQRLAERLHETLSTLAPRMSELPDWRAPAARLLLENLRLQFGGDNIGVLAQDGAVIAVARPLSAPPDLLSPQNVERAVRRVITTDCRIDPVTESAACAAFHPVPNGTPATGYVLFAQGRLEWPVRLHDQIPLPSDTTVTVIDERGTVVMHGSDRRWVGHSVADEPVFGTIRALGTVGTAHGTLLDGVERVFGFSPLPSAAGASGLSVAVGLPLQGATATADRLLLGVFLALGFTVIAGMALSWVVCEAFLVRRVKALVAATERLARGDAGVVAAGGGGPTELEQLARSFDNMVSALQARHNALEQSGDSVMVANRDGIIEYVNAAFVRLTGFSADDAIGSAPRRVKRGQHTVDFYKDLWGTVLSGAPFRAVFVNQRKDGTTYHEEQIISPVRDAAGNITHFVSTGRDISARRRAEEALRRVNERLEDEANRIASVLHDEAGQFLTACHLTLADVSRDLPASARDKLKDVRAHLDEVEAQLRRLAHELRPRALEDLGLAPALKFLADGTARRSGVEIQVQTDLTTPCPLAIETAVYRLVQEALTNMMKHSRATQARVVVTQDARDIHCTVSDNGVGFDMDDQSCHAFGLGLLGIKDRVEAVRGTFRIASEPGKGTELHASIPLQTSDVTAETAR